MTLTAYQNVIHWNAQKRFIRAYARFLSFPLLCWPVNVAGRFISVKLYLQSHVRRCAPCVRLAWPESACLFAFFHLVSGKTKCQRDRQIENIYLWNIKLTSHMWRNVSLGSNLLTHSTHSTLNISKCTGFSFYFFEINSWVISWECHYGRVYNIHFDEHFSIQSH